MRKLYGMGLGFSRRICERLYQVTFVWIAIGVGEIGVSVRVVRQTWIVNVGEGTGLDV